LPFAAEASATERDWLDFLAGGRLDDHDPEAAKDFVCSDVWIKELGTAEETYLTNLHLAVAHMQNEDFSDAEIYLEKSLALRESSFARRNRALIHEIKGNINAALLEYEKALELSGNDAELVEEMVRFMKKHGLNDAVETLVAQLQNKMETFPERIQLAIAELKFEQGDTDEAERLLFSREFATIREGETILTDLWTKIQQKRGNVNQTIPKQIDFRVITDI